MAVKMKRKKTERIYTPAESFKQYTMKLYEHSDRIAFSYYGDDKAIHDLTYREFSDNVRSLAASLDEKGLAGKRIALIGETSPMWVESYVAIVLAGGVAIPMDRELDIGEVENFFEFAEAEGVIFSESFNQKFEHMAGGHPTVKHFIALKPDGCAFKEALGDNFYGFDDLIARGRELMETYDPPVTEDMNRMAVMLFTSGTTGTSKCVMLSEKNVLSALNAACECVEFSPDDTIVSVLPIHHTYELCCMLAGLNYGMRVTINDSLKHVMKNFATFKPTGLVLVPLFISTIYKRIWDEARKKGQDKKLLKAIKFSRSMRKIGIDMRQTLFRSVTGAFGGRLCKIVSGGAPLNPKLVEDFEEFGVYIAEGYGITECSPLLACNPYFAPKRGSVGPAVTGCTIRIEEGRTNDLGYTEGEICAKGNNVMLGYYKNPEATAEVFDEDGWFHTGDIGYMDEDGYVFITGRKKYVIVLESGKNVFPEEIEEYLARIDGVCESVVLGRKVPGGDEIILTALIYPDTTAFPAGTSREVIEQTLRDRVGKMNKDLVSYKQIRAVEFRTKEFEKTTSRKIKRHLVE